MSWKCLFGHKWEGCKCKQCGKTRDEQHDWEGCKCKRCSEKRDEQHDWENCRCKRCGKKTDEQHDWEGCKCKRCGETRDEQHDWEYESSREEEIQFYYNSPATSITVNTYRCRKCGAIEDNPYR